MYCGLGDQSCEISHYQLVESWLVTLWFDPKNPSVLYNNKNNIAIDLNTSYTFCTIFGYMMIGMTIIALIIWRQYDIQMQQ